MGTFFYSNMDPQAVAQQFVQFYYNQFDADRSGIASLYTDQSMLTFEDKKAQGVQNIVQIFVGLGFSQVKHVVTSIDAQPSPGDGILVFVSGNVHIDGNTNPVKFSQVFNLQPNGSGSFFILNDIMRL